MGYRQMSMKRATLVCAVLAVAGTGALVWQQGSMAELRQPDRTAGFTNAGTTENTNAADEQQLAALREETKDLPRLRNEVTQLRARKVELDVARREHEQLSEAKRTGATVPREAPPGFISKESLVNAGLVTPEDAVQTFFWAMRQGDLRMILQALSPTNAERKEFESLPPDKRAEFEKSFGADPAGNPMNNFSDFTVRGKEAISDDSVVLHIGSSLTTNTMRVEVDRFGGEWRLRDMPRAGPN
jgi:hypothetical protein